ncbi:MULTISPECIES: hypothetical protein [Halorussus]|uniref:DUF7096 domain-containing protein n=1 Tax=Halorussus TaxID=1070314 RepID=UPI000E2178C4|nr:MULTISPECIES: hypothetical protein [Halorussus]NHN59559.1 hypothetical protein [Halorussus sp. JP-T4]
MKPSVVLLIGAVALIGATGAVAADGGQSGAVGEAMGVGPESQSWPGGDPQTNGNNSTSVSPGQQLAGAVGAQGASLGGELWNRTLTDRLANATTPSERARVVADENETLTEHLDALTGVRANLTEKWEDGDLSEGRYRTSLSAFVVRARTVELRANQTARAAENLSVFVRERYEINVTRIRHLADRAHELHQFEGPIGREVADSTLANESALVAGNESAPAAGNRTTGWPSETNDP